MTRHFETLNISQIDQSVALVKLARPARMNALTGQMLTEIAEVFAQINGSENIRAVVLSGEGKAFCAGQDLTERDPAQNPWPFDLEKIQLDRFHPAIEAIATCSKPVIAAVNGITVGAGAGIALACDIVIAAQSAKFAFSFAKVGLSSDAGCAWHLNCALGPARARAILLRAETLSADEAARSGLIWKSVPDTELEPAAIDVAQELAAGAGVAQGLIKQVVRAAQTVGYGEYLQIEAELQGVAGRTDDYREAVTAFLAKRVPKFSGR